MDSAATIDASAGRAESGVVAPASARMDSARLSALEASERRYRRLFETAKDGILVIDGDTGLIIDVNPFVTELMGYSHAYFLGKYLWELSAFKNIAASKEAFADLQAKPYVRYEDLALKASDGRLLDVEFISSVYRDGDETTIQCNIRDVGLRRQGERQTLEERACLNAILESSLTPIFAVDSTYHYTAYNRAYAANMKSTFDVDVKVGALVVACQATRGDWLATKAALDRALQGESLVESGTSSDASRSLRFFETAYYPIYSDAGKVIGVAVYMRDATAAKLAEDQLRFRNLILSTQLDSSLDGIQVIDVFGSTIATNRRFVDVWGIPLDIIESESPVQLLRLMLEKMVYPGDFEQRIEALSTIRGKEDRGDICLTDGRTLDCYSAPMLNASGELFGRVWQFRDITASKLDQNERLHLQAQLQISQKLEALGSLAGGVAHDFNNLLAVMLSYIAFVKDGLAEGLPVLDDLLEVQKAAERATALTRSLLAFSRKQVLQPVLLNLNLIVSGMEGMLRSLVGESIEFRVVLAPNLDQTRADPTQVEQVLMNLVINARDAMQSGGVLTIETANVEISQQSAACHLQMTPGPYVALAITDTGCGMDEPTKSKIFEPFFSTKSKGKGTGLGLSTVFGIVEQSGGNIWVISEPGQGTTLKVHLPRSHASSIQAPYSPPSVPSRSTQAETILVVEDEGALLTVAARTLREAGYKVMTATSGEDALLIATQYVGEIDLLLTDVIMPGLNGRMLAEELKLARPSLQVLYISGYAGSVLGQRGVLDRGMHFLAKPFIAIDLARKVRTVLNG